jgi:hypothetical protein
MDLDLGVAHKPLWDVATVLVTVKAYPVIGRKTGESVCVAGVRLDHDDPSWIRLFPVPFRSLAKAQQFKKYAVVQLRVQRSSGSDRRPESHLPDLDSLRVGEVLDTRRHWAKRWDAIGGLVGATTACRLNAETVAGAQSAPSLGLVKPTRVLDVVVAENPSTCPVSHRRSTSTCSVTRRRCCRLSRSS